MANISYQPPHRPLRFRLINWTGTKLRLNRLPLLSLTEESLLEEAQRLSGLSDWGDEDFLIPLRIFLESLKTEAHLNVVGRYFFRQDCIRLLINRLQLQNDFKRHPEIFQGQIQRPLFVVGMFRSGTTFLHNLLSQDSSSRWLHLAEAFNPSPSPNQTTWENDPRLKNTAKWVKFQKSLSSNVFTAHNISANRPAECSRLFEHGFIGHLFDFRADVRTYSEWLQEQDLVGSYQYYRQQLQYLGWHWSGNHWVLKAPAHLYALDALLTVFPDACIIHLHRDPLEVLPSCCSLSAMGRNRFTDHQSLTAIGDYWQNTLTKAVERAMQVRAKAAAKRFYDVNYIELIQEPIRIVRQIYEYFGYPFNNAVEKNLKRWIGENPQHKHGIHHYSLEKFGLEAKEINRKFAHYCQKFNLK
ncbi:conserved hypothetical protein [Beggiatoa sp. PS]|nr:conserved hypothetical protein [Beggiatoa sp. PS]